MITLSSSPFSSPLRRSANSHTNSQTWSNPSHTAGSDELTLCFGASKPLRRIGVTVASLGALLAIGSGVSSKANIPDKTTAVVQTQNTEKDLNKELEKLDISQKDIEAFLKQYSKTPFKYEVTDTTDPARIKELQAQTPILDAIYFQTLAGRPDIQAAIAKLAPNGITVQIRNLADLGTSQDDDKTRVAGKHYCRSTPYIELAAKDEPAKAHFTHEFMHLLDCMGIYNADLYFGLIDGRPPNLTEHQKEIFDTEREKIIANIKNKTSNINPYAARVYEDEDPKKPNYAEFFTVTADAFFNASPALYKESPELWNLYREYFNVNMPTPAVTKEPLETFNAEDAAFIHTELPRVMNLPDSPFQNIIHTNGIAPERLLNSDIKMIKSLIQMYDDQNKWLSETSPRLARLLNDYEEPKSPPIPATDPKTGLTITSVLARFNPKTGLFDPAVIEQQLTKQDELKRLNDTINDIKNNKLPEATHNVDKAKKAEEQVSTARVYTMGGGLILIVSGVGLATASTFRRRYDAASTRTPRLEIDLDPRDSDNPFGGQATFSSPYGFEDFGSSTQDRSREEASSTPYQFYSTHRPGSEGYRAYEDPYLRDRHGRIKTTRRGGFKYKRGFSDEARQRELTEIRRAQDNDLF